MKKENNSKVWIILLILSVLFLAWSIPLLLLSGGQDVLEQGLNLAGSTFAVSELDQAALGFLNMSMLKPVWEEVWIGILGIYCAVSLKKMKRHAWWLGLFWGIMLITNAATQGIYETLILHWPSACLQTYLFLILGTVAVISIIISRKNYFGNLA